MRFIIYGNGGGIDKVKEKLANPKETFETIKEVFEIIVKRYCGMLDIKDLSIRYYCYDNRIEKDVYMVVTNRCGNEDYIKRYKYPQFVSYLVNI